MHHRDAENAEGTDTRQVESGSANTDIDDDGITDRIDASLRVVANEVYSAINERGRVSPESLCVSVPGGPNAVRTAPHPARVRRGSPPKCRIVWRDERKGTIQPPDPMTLAREAMDIWPFPRALFRRQNGPRETAENRIPHHR